MRHDPLPPIPRDAPFRHNRDRSRAIALLLGALVLKLLFLAALDRPWGCACARIWAMPDNPSLNSQVLLDPYALMHVVAGALLVRLMIRLRPDWTEWTLIAAAVISSTIWEMVENLPAVVGAFNYESGDPMEYSGDSILNAMADGVAVAVGGLAALRLRTPTVLLIALATELGLSLWIGDGFVIVVLRALGFWS